MHEIIQLGIIDDHVMFRKGLIALINLFPGYQVLIEASNGKDFIAKLAPDKVPHIILMDIKMPIMDGYQTSEWLRENYPEVKILALSTMDSELAIVKMIRSGAKGYILKDADPEELKIAFREILSIGYYYNEFIGKKVLGAVSKITNLNDKIATAIRLTEKEINFFKLICSELQYKEIAEKMHVSVRTVEGYRDDLCEKLNLKTRVGLVLYAIKNEIFSL